MEHVALYRQFRPENFDEVVEQKAAVTALRQSVKTGRLGHAYLFCGQRGTGKTSIARIFARAINCESPNNGNPCNQCPTCKGIMDGSLLDVIEIDAASNRSIDNIKKICEEVNYSPSKAKYKVYIIDEVHMITNEAFNALLKTLEEPPAHAIFLFATTEPHSIPPTIHSRCQRFDFRRISTDSIISRLRYICDHENIKSSDEALKLIASLSDGAMRDAISVLDQAASAAGPDGITDESIEEMTGTVNIAFLSEMAEILIEGRFDELLSKCRELSDSGRDVIQFSLDLAGYFRNLLIVRVMPDPTSLIPASATALKRMYEVANKTNTNTLVGFISSMSKMISDLKWSPSVRTSFEINLLRLCGRKIKMDEVPLVIPDFVEKQAAAAAEISARQSKAIVTEPVVATTVADIAPVPAPTPTSVETPAETPVITPVETPAPIEAPAPAPEAKDETSPEQSSEVASEPVVEPAPETKVDKSVEETPSVPFFAPIVDEDADNNEEEPEETPMENQMDIFSFSAPASEPAPVVKPEPVIESVPVSAPVIEPEPEIPVITNTESPAPKSSIFADLSSSFMDDIMKGNVAPAVTETKPESNLYEPTGRIGETKQTRLSATFDMAGLVQAPVKTDPDSVWESIKDELSAIDLTDTTLILQGDSANIVFNQDYVMEALKVNPENKKVSRSIKSHFEGIEHVYMFSRAQAERKGLINPPVTNEPSEPAPADNPFFGADEFMQLAKQQGYNTEIHFGDN